MKDTLEMNISRPKISFIVPIYNREGFLERCINSIRSQSLKNIEIILVNDGSTDNSEQICKFFVNQDDRVSYYYLKQGGVSIARNYGMQMAKGEYLGFVDSDDYLETNFAEKMYLTAIKKQSFMTCCGIRQIQLAAENREVYLPKILSINKFIKQNVYIRNPIWNKIFQAKFIRMLNVTFPEGARIAEDYAFICMIILASIENKVNVSYVREPLYNYWQHNNSTMSNLYSITDVCDNISDLMKSVNALSNFASKRSNYKKAGQLLKTILRDYYLTTLPFHIIFQTLKTHKIDESETRKIFNTFMDYQTKYKCYSNIYYWIICIRFQRKLRAASAR